MALTVYKNKLKAARQLKKIYTVSNNDAVPHHGYNFLFRKDPDPTFHFYVDLDPELVPHQRGTPPRLRFEPLRRYCERIGPSMAPFKPQQLLNI